MRKIGVKIQNFKNSKKVPLGISEIHVVSKFGPIRMRIAADSLSEPHTDGRTLYAGYAKCYFAHLLYSLVESAKINQITPRSESPSLTLFLIINLMDQCF